MGKSEILQHTRSSCGTPSYDIVSGHIFRLALFRENSAGDHIGVEHSMLCHPSIRIPHDATFCPSVVGVIQCSIYTRCVSTALSWALVDHAPCRKRCRPCRRDPPSSIALALCNQLANSVEHPIMAAYFINKVLTLGLSLAVLTQPGFCLIIQ